MLAETIDTAGRFSWLRTCIAAAHASTALLLLMHAHLHGLQLDDQCRAWLAVLAGLPDLPDVHVTVLAARGQSAHQCGSIAACQLSE